MNPELTVDLKKQTEEVRDQGTLPTCLSHAASTVHRAHRDHEERLSAETLHYHSNDGCLNSAVSLSQLQQTLRTKGQPEDRYCNPVASSGHGDWSPPTDVEYYRYDSKAKSSPIEFLKNIIREANFPILGITFPDQFYNPQAPWVISSGRTRGAHAVVGVGLAEYKSEVIVLIQNSWGSEWGNQGFAYLDNSFLKTHLQEILILFAGDSS